MWKLRSFLNTDTPELSKLWQLHSASFSPQSAFSSNVWELCIFSKPYFRADELVVATNASEQVVGFVHFGVVSPSRDNSTTLGSIHRLCVAPSSDEAQVAKLLIGHAIAQIRARGCADRCMALGCGPFSIFYLGIAEGDNAMGILAQDQRTQTWFQEAGFEPVRPTECWELELSTFRPPMDRMQIQARRNCSIGRMLEEDYEDWQSSVILGHCEQIRFHLMVKSPPSLGGTLTCWYPDAELAEIDNSIVRIILPDVPNTEMERERFVYLVSESIRQLQQERKRIVRAVASAERQSTITLLQRLGFRSVSHGLLFEKQLDV